MIFLYHRPENEEYYEVKKFRKRGRDLPKKKRILTSLAENERCVVHAELNYGCGDIVTKRVRLKQAKSLKYFVNEGCTRI